MNSMREKLLSKLAKKGKELDPMEKKAKLGVIGELSKQANDMLSDKIHPLKKVTVASDSKEGLKEGLDKAAGLLDHTEDMAHEHDPEKMMEQAEEETGADLEHDDEAGEPAEHMKKMAEHGYNPAPLANADHENMSDEELEHMIATLHAAKAKRGMKA